MDNFKNAFDRTMKSEGLYSKDPTDPGGETYRGISRRFFPSWPGWGVIDQRGPSVKGLDLLTEEFYRREFWDRCSGDSLPAEVAIEIFDSAVNCGVTRACTWLQRALNLLNRNGKEYPDLVEDGKLGPGTLRTLQAHINKEGSTKILLKVMNILQGKHYLEIMQSTPTQEKYARGWLARVEAA